MNAPLETMTEPLVLRADAGGIATLTLNRPAQFNAINGAMLTELSDKQARYIGVEKAGPYKGDSYRY